MKTLEEQIDLYLHDYPTGYAADINESALLREATEELRRLRAEEERLRSKLQAIAIHAGGWSASWTEAMSEGDRLAAIKARLEAATKGPWLVCAASDSRCRCGQVWSIPADFPVAMATGNDGDYSVPDWLQSNNATFIAHAPEDIAYLLGRVEELECYARHNDDPVNFCARLDGKHLPCTCGLDSLVSGSGEGG